MQQTFELFSEYLSGSPSYKKLGKTLVFLTVDCIIDQWSLPKSMLTKMRLCLRACACVGIASKYREQNIVRKNIVRKNIVRKNIVRQNVVNKIL